MSERSLGQITINSRKYDGSIGRSWKCDLIRKSGTELVFVGTFDLDISHPDLGNLKRGTISYEYYWLDRWYNIFCFYEPDGRFRNYYCNVNMPPVFVDGILNYVDLDIDVVVWPDGSFKILDEGEYEQNAIKFDYPEDVREKAADALHQVLELIRHQKLPDTREILQQNR